MADIPTVPTIFDGADLGRLKVRGAAYKAIETPAGRLCVPTHFILGYKWRRWEVTVSDIYETDNKGKRLGTEPAPNNKLPPSCFSCDHFTMFGAQEGCGRPKESPCPHGRDAPAKSAREYHQDKFAGVPNSPPNLIIDKDLVIAALEDKLKKHEEMWTDKLAHANYDHSKKVAELQHKIEQVDRERLGLYPVIDEMKRVRATFEKDLAQDRRIISDQQAELERLREEAKPVPHVEGRPCTTDQPCILRRTYFCMFLCIKNHRRNPVPQTGACPPEDCEDRDCVNCADRPIGGP